MFEAVRNNKRVAQVILAILIVPFAFFVGGLCNFALRALW